MNLTLTVLSFKNRPITEIATVSIGNEGGSIGRSDNNTLVLPDTEKFVSRHHATIKAENGYYYLSDTSLGGVTINGEELPLHNATVRIDNGTRLKIGEYEIAVVITSDESIVDDFLFVPEPIAPTFNTFPSIDEPWIESDSGATNNLMTDSFPSHEELIHQDTPRTPDFQSRLANNQSPLFDSYIAPSIIPSASPASVETIPESFSFDDLFSATDKVTPQTQPINKPAAHNDFEDFFGAAISEMVAGNNQSISPTEQHDETAPNFAALHLGYNDTPIEQVPPSEVETSQLGKETATEWVDEEISSSKIAPPFSTTSETTSLFADIEQHEPALATIHTTPPLVAVTETIIEKTFPAPADSVLFNAFLQGVAVECSDIRPEQQAETLSRIGQMFRKLIDGTVAVLRSRAEFKSLCRVNMTVIKATNNNPLKFTVSTDDVLRQLIENKTDGFLASTAAIEEAFNDIMNHQLAMQAGIQSSLTDLLKTFDPRIIEKQFEQGLVLQKKSKCWDKYEETYRNTVEDAVENFFGEEFVSAYEKQMSQLVNTRKK
jgi:type VI secretion system protein